MANRDVFECLLDQANDIYRPYLEIAVERARQQERFGGAEGDVAHPATPDQFRLAVLMEEVGEVARAILDNEGDERLAEEVTQVAAVCVAWLQSRER